MNEHSLTCTIYRERYAAAVRQLSNGTTGDDQYKRLATEGGNIQNVKRITCTHTRQNQLKVCVFYGARSIRSR